MHRMHFFVLDFLHFNYYIFHLINHEKYIFKSLFSIYRMIIYHYYFLFLHNFFWVESNFGIFFFFLIRISFKTRGSWSVELYWVRFDVLRYVMIWLFLFWGCGAILQCWSFWSLQALFMFLENKFVGIR